MNDFSLNSETDSNFIAVAPDEKKGGRAALFS